ncbi:hypothetical protein BC830DRAFT_1164165 [Chytriomyces sp. MP71]|nr:hypothetical protein BC830DRAFT_1164165 [Chytriomyces sp. MP71]
MPALIIDPIAHKATAIATVVTVLKFYLTVFKQGGARFKAGSRPPEDAKLSLAKTLGASKVQQTFGITAATNDDGKLDKAKLIDIRWQRMVLNDLENIPLGLIVAWASLLSPYSPKLHAIFVSLFAAFRIVHTVSYANELQPHRAIGWGGALLCILGMATNGVLGVFTASSD